MLYKHLKLLILALFSLVYAGTLSASADPRVYLSVFYDGRVGIALDFSEGASGLLAIMSEEGKWDIQIKDKKNQKIEYYEKGRLKGKIRKIGDIVIDRFDVDHEVLMGQPKKIGNVLIKYYAQRSSAYYGKIMRIGDLTFTYHSYQTLPSYNKLNQIRNVATKAKINIQYFNENTKGFAVSGKVRSVDKSVTFVYGKEGEISRMKGVSANIDVQFFTKAQLQDLEGEMDFSADEKLESVLDSFLK